MANVRKRHSAEFKAKVAIEAIKQHKTLNELTAEYAVHATQIHNWKKQALRGHTHSVCQSKARNWARSASIY